MSNLEVEELRESLDKLSGKLRSSAEEFRTQGLFPDIHQAFRDQLRLRNDELRKKVIEAARKGTTLEFIKAELWRDYNAFINEALLFEERLDTETKRNA
jgi:hypothetical protein